LGVGGGRRARRPQENGEGDKSLGIEKRAKPRENLQRPALSESPNYRGDRNTNVREENLRHYGWGRPREFAERKGGARPDKETQEAHVSGTPEGRPKGVGHGNIEGNGIGLNVVGDLKTICTGGVGGKLPHLGEMFGGELSNR